LAKIGDGAPIIGQDIVRPYLLLTTSFDGSMATTAKLTAIRVVCHNTLSVAVRDDHTHAGTADRAVVKVNHSMPFDARDVRMQLGIFAGTFEKWMIQTRCLARQKNRPGDGVAHGARTDVADSVQEPKLRAGRGAKGVASVSPDHDTLRWASNRIRPV
jgi:hypothetical protein